MALRITAIQQQGGTGHEHIIWVWYTDMSTGAASDCSRAKMVSMIEDMGMTAYVSEGGRRAKVGVVTPRYGPKYLRTYADGVWTDNLLALPRRYSH